jgi:hypothetical protein
MPIPLADIRGDEVPDGILRDEALLLLDCRLAPDGHAPVPVVGVHVRQVHVASLAAICREP